MDDERIAILIVDDSRSDAQLLRRWLSGSRVVRDVHMVHDGREAVDFLRSAKGLDPALRPRLVLLDVNLRRMTGFEVLAEIKSQPELASLCVVVLSGSTFDEDRRRAQELRADLYLTKPFDADGFAALVAAIDDLWQRLAASGQESAS